TAAGLGFLGLGAQPPQPEWGAMIASGRRFLIDQWWVATMPGIAIFIVSLGFNLLAAALRDALDPTARKCAFTVARTLPPKAPADADAPDGRRPARGLPDAPGAERGGARRRLHPRPRTARHRRRQRFGQEPDRPRDPRADA